MSKKPHPRKGPYTAGTWDLFTALFGLRTVLRILLRPRLIMDPEHVFLKSNGFVHLAADLVQKALVLQT